MNYELIDIAEKLRDKYGSGKHWEIIRAEKVGQFEGEENCWIIKIKPAPKEGENENENN